MAVDAVSYAKSFTDDIEFSPEDAGRTDINYLCEVIEAVISAGASVINIPDTTGYTMPEEFGEKINLVKKKKVSALVATHNLDLIKKMDRVFSLTKNGFKEVK